MSARDLQAARRTAPLVAATSRGAVRRVTALAFALLAAGAVPAAAGVWTTFTTANGLPGTRVNALAETDSGTILVATEDQLAEFDGLRFQRLNARYAVPPAFGLITDIAVGPDSNVWVGTQQNGVFRLGPTSFQQFKREDGLGDRRVNFVQNLLVDSDGTVWATTNNGGLSFFPPGATEWSTLTVGDGLPSMILFDLGRDADGDLWITSNADLGNGGLVRYDGATFEHFVRPGGFDRNQLQGMEIASDGRIWVTSDDGLAVFDENGNWLQDFFSTTGLRSNSLDDVVEDSHGAIWIGTTNLGIQRWNGGDWESLDASSGLAANTTTDMLVDRAGVLWVGTFGGGLSRYEGSLWLTFDTSQGFVGPVIVDVDRGPVEDLSPRLERGVTNGPAYVAMKSDQGGAGSQLGSVFRVAGLRAEPVRDERDSVLSGDFTSVFAVPGGVLIGASDRDPNRPPAERAISVVLTVLGSRVVQRDTLPAGSAVNDLLAARSGDLWATTKAKKLFRRQGGIWSEFALPGLEGASIGSLAEDLSGRIWVADRFLGRAARIDPASGGIELFGGGEGLPGFGIEDVFVDSRGDVWFATFAGAARFRGAGVDRVFTTADGLSENSSLSLGEDQRGRIWVGTSSGVAYYDGVTWAPFGTGDGLPAADVVAMVADTSEALLATSNGLALFRGDRVPPKALVVGGPPPVLGSRLAQIAFFGGDLDSQNGFLTYSWSLDGDMPRPFSSSNTANLFGLADGLHVFEVFARDRALNVTPAPARFVFEVDATPPQPRIESPTFARAVSGTVPVVGSVEDLRFESYAVQVRPAGSSEDWTTLAADTVRPAPETPLAEWDTRAFPDGNYDLRVVARDTLDLTGFAVVEVIVDNQEPRNAVTSPARINNQEGGRVFTLNAEVEAYFPPQALDQDRIVSIVPLGDPGLLPPGGNRFLGGWRLTPQDFDTAKPVTLTFSLAALDPSGSGFAGAPAVFRVGADTSFTFLGGSVDERRRTLTTTIDRLGDVAVYDGLFAAAAGADRALDVQPRAFSPEGRTFDTRAAVSFDLDEADFVKVYVYDRSGRLVRRVFEGDLPPGRNVIHWDGRAGNGAVVPSGVYLVAVQARGETDVKPVAVVNR